MRKEYDFSKSVKNPYAKHLKKQVTLRLGIDVIDYFKKLAEETGMNGIPNFILYCRLKK